MRLLKLVPENTNIHFLKWRNVAMTISLLSIIASIVLVSVRGLNLGVDFVGGQMVRVTFSDTPDLDDLRKRVDALGFGDVTIQQFGGPHEVTIRTPLPEGGEGASNRAARSEHTSELQSLMRISYAVFCLKKKKQPKLSSITPSNKPSRQISVRLIQPTHAATPTISRLQTSTD